MGPGLYLPMECAERGRIRTPGCDPLRKLRSTGNRVAVARHRGSCSAQCRQMGRAKVLGCLDLEIGDYWLREQSGIMECVVGEPRTDCVEWELAEALGSVNPGNPGQRCVVADIKDDCLPVWGAGNWLWGWRTGERLYGELVVQAVKIPGKELSGQNRWGEGAV